MPLPVGEGLSELLNTGYACRGLQPKTFGRGFDSRRLHQYIKANCPQLAFFLLALHLIALCSLYRVLFPLRSIEESKYARCVETPRPIEYLSSMYVPLRYNLHIANQLH
jgi:hypothetical protein